MMLPRPTWIAIAVLAAGAVAVAAPGPSPWLLVNESRSVPSGLYVLSPAAPDRGRLVTVAQPEAARAYLRTLDVPPDMHLLKRIVAAGGARVCAEHGRLSWPGGTAAILHRDRRGRLLPHWTGCRRLASDERLLLGDTPTSFDSRYFGPLRRSAVLGVYREVWTW
jgi:type IV secretory pathway protease TraF